MKSVKHKKVLQSPSENVPSPYRSYYRTCTTRRPAWRPRPSDGYPLSDSLRCSVPVTALVKCPALISLLRYHWTSHGWDDPLESPYLSPFFGDAGEECAEDFIDAGFSTGYFDQA